MKIWIINHYAIPPSLGGMVRHYYFSKYLQEKGHEVKIFTSSSIHNTDVNMISDKRLYLEKDMDGVRYTFVRNSDYRGNGLGRIANMLQFPLRVWRTCRNFEKPDVIYASSPDLLTAVLAVLMAKRLGVRKVVEIRDLWPESIVEYGVMPKKNPVVQVLYQAEKWLYRNADELIFTMEGGKKYIRGKGWTRGIDPKKIHHINNGVDLEEFDYNKEHFHVQDEDLENEDIFRIVYAGSIRKANNLDIVVECARKLQEKEPKIKFLIWGDGNERKKLQEKCKSLGLKNIVFKGKVEKKYIPYILSKSDINLMHGGYNNITRFGCSANKIFDYLAAGRPILSDLNTEYDFIEKYRCGMKAGGGTAEKLIEIVLSFEKISEEESCQMGSNGRKLSQKYDYKKLAERVEKVLLEALK